MKTERFIDSKLTESIIKENGIAVYYSNTALVAKGYSGKASKPSFNYKFRNVAQMTEYINTFITQQESYHNRINKEKAEKKAKQAILKASDYYSIGDIVVNSWGYEQTNVEFCQVVEVKGKTIVVREISQKEVPGSGGFMSCDVTAVKDDFITDKTISLQVKAGSGSFDHFLSGSKSYYHFSKWGGGKQYKSWYA